MIARVFGGLRYALRRIAVIAPRRRKWAKLNQPFDRLRGPLPDYVLAEVVPTSGRAGMVARAVFTLRHGIEPRVRKIDRAEPCFCENLIAFPSRTAGEAFGLLRARH